MVPRRYRLAVHERIRADGLVLEPVTTEDVASALQVFRSAGIEAVAVCFINSYVNPSHELEVEEYLRSAGFDGDVSLSHRLSREYREYERTSTTVIDAYVRGLTSRYLSRLATALGEAQFRGEILVTRSGGGVMSSRDVEQRPFEAIQSGPVAGVEGAASICRRRGIRLAIAADVGGTSFDASLIVEGRPQVNYEGEVLGWPVQTPWVDVQSIGAGGGSIAYADHGLLRVGPMSAGASPGPASYGQGGLQPTVTDAALVLGMLGNGVLSNDFQLDASAASSAMEPLATELGMSTDAAAQGVIRVVTASMAEVLRERTIGQGEDPRGAQLLAFGGAGPLFATLLASELGVDQILIPQHAGNFSAWGLLGQDVTRDIARTHIRLLSQAAIDDLNAELREMFEELEARDQRRRDSGDVERLAAFDLRYVGQDHSLTVTFRVDPITGIPPASEIQARFVEQYFRRFNASLDEPVEVVALRATTRGIDQSSEPPPSMEVPSEARSMEGSIEAYSFTSGSWIEFKLVPRQTLGPNSVQAGPMIVTEPTTTTYVDYSFAVKRADDGVLELTRTSSSQ